MSGGYGFKDAGDKAHGVWTPNEETAEAARRRVVQQEAAAGALAQMQAKIDAIKADATLTDQEKRRAIGLLSASGYGDEEDRVLGAAKEEV